MRDRDNSKEYGLRPCPQCGCKRIEFDSTGALECYGYAWQTMTIECLNEEGHCGASISFNFDYFGIDNSNDVIINAWNALESKTRTEAENELHASEN